MHEIFIDQMKLAMCMDTCTNVCLFWRLLFFVVIFVLVTVNFVVVVAITS